jgi:Secretion system C-terminal sorting domain/FG-GAP-like repeat
MKATLLLAIWLLPFSITCSYAQNWETETLRDNILGAWTRSADFDQDSDPDILVQSGDSILWYENLRPGWMPHLIDATFYNSKYGFVDVVDLDGDGDPDVLKAPATLTDGTDELTWNENLSNGSAWEKHTILTVAGSVGWLQNAYGDLDGDGDIDIAYSEYDFINTPAAEGLYWLENEGDGGTWTKHLLRAGNHWYGSIADMDGDGDLDIAASWDSIFWLENSLPVEDWTVHKIADGAASNYVGTCDDLTGDGAADLVSSPVASNGGLAFFINPGWEEVTINPAQQLYVGPSGNIDGDGDLDVTYGGAGFLPQALGWAENQNNGTEWVLHDITPSTVIQRIPTGIEDIDDDGDMDIISLIFDVNTGFGSAFWAANPIISTGTSNPEVSSIDVLLSPNPAAEILNLQVQAGPNAFFQIEIFDVNGRQVKAFEMRGGTSTGIDVADWSAGNYFVKVFNEKQMVVKRFVKI